MGHCTCKLNLTKHTALGPLLVTLKPYMLNWDSGCGGFWVFHELSSTGTMLTDANAFGARNRQLEKASKKKKKFILEF